MNIDKRRFLVKAIVLLDYLYLNLKDRTIYSLFYFLRELGLDSVNSSDEIKEIKDSMKNTDNAIDYLSDCEELWSIFKMIEEFRDADQQ